MSEFNIKFTPTICVDDDKAYISHRGLSEICAFVDRFKANKAKLDVAVEALEFIADDIACSGSGYLLKYINETLEELKMNNKCNTCTVNIQVGCLANSDMEAENCSDYLESWESKLSEVFKMLEGEEQSGIQSARITEWLSANKELK